MKLEVCIDSAESALIADRAGADRVELCENLFGGGTTPSAGSIITARKLVSLGLHVIIRPRPGDFCYNETEFRVMLEDIRFCRENGVDGVVIGILSPDGTVDVERNRALVKEAGAMNVTFHRAFDVTRDPFQALEDIIAIGCSRILTSGQEAGVIEGADLIRELIARAGGRIIIMPGGDITERKMERVASLTGASEFHMNLDSPAESLMDYRPGHINMGGVLSKPEYGNVYADEGRINTILNTLNKG